MNVDLVTKELTLILEQYAGQCKNLAFATLSFSFIGDF